MAYHEQAVPNRERRRCPRCQSVLQAMQYRHSLIYRCRICPHSEEEERPIPPFPITVGRPTSAPLKQCIGCGQHFTPNSNIQRYHSVECRRADYQRRKGASHAETVIVRKCGYCGKPLDDDRSANALYCNVLCQWAHINYG